MLRFAILCRVSTEGQEKEGESLVVQQKVLHHCVNNLDGQVVKVYSGNESATAGDKSRPILDQLLEDSALGIFDAVIVYDLSRWSRDPIKSKISLGILKKNGVKLFIQTQQYDLDNLETNLIVGILNEINAFSAAIQSKKSVESKLERAKHGFASSGGRMPFARYVDSASKHQDKAVWMIDPEKHSQALNVYDLYVNKRKQITDIAKLSSSKFAMLLRQVPNHHTIVDTEGLFSQMNEPYQQGGEAQVVKIELAPTTARSRQAVPMDPYPDIAQE